MRRTRMERLRGREINTSEKQREAMIKEKEF